jgi:hypothetical protein
MSSSIAAMAQQQQQQMSQSVAARGRIQQVIAQARAESNRASLKEPSRPITPASYDYDRSSLDQSVNKQKKRSSKVDSIHRSVSLHSRNVTGTTGTTPVNAANVNSNSFDFSDLTLPQSDSGTLDLQGGDCKLLSMISYVPNSDN